MNWTNVFVCKLCFRDFAKVFLVLQFGQELIFNSSYHFLKQLKAITVFFKLGLVEGWFSITGKLSASLKNCALD